MTLLVYQGRVHRVITWYSPANGKRRARWCACPEGLPDLIAYCNGPGGAIANLGYLLDKKERLENVR